jgi:hypothetical protein
MHELDGKLVDVPDLKAWGSAALVAAMIGALLVPMLYRPWGICGALDACREHHVDAGSLRVVWPIVLLGLGVAGAVTAQRLRRRTTASDPLAKALEDLEFSTPWDALPAIPHLREVLREKPDHIDASTRLGEICMDLAMSLRRRAEQQPGRYPGAARWKEYRDEGLRAIGRAQELRDRLEIAKIGRPPETSRVRSLAWKLPRLFDSQRLSPGEVKQLGDLFARHERDLAGDADDPAGADAEALARLALAVGREDLARRISTTVAATGLANREGSVR